MGDNMKNKIFTIILIILFIALLLFISNFVNKQNEIAINGVAQENVVKKEENDMDDIMSVTSENFEAEVLKSDKKVLIDFYADWCGPCKMLSPIVEEVAKENESIKVVKVNIDYNQALAVKYGVSSIPTLVVIENGETKNVSVGLISKEEVEALVK